MAAADLTAGMSSLVEDAEELLRGLKKRFLAAHPSTAAIYLTPETYFLRPHDRDGLSVFRARFYKDAGEPMQEVRGLVGMGMVTAGEVTALDPSVLKIQPKIHNPADANIVGLPRSSLCEDATEEERDRATELARKLCSATRIVVAPSEHAIRAIIKSSQSHG